MRIGGFQKFSLIDYPDRISCIVFTQGCNFNCGYCHNPELLAFESSFKTISADEILEFLKARTKKLDAVVITGGEPTLQVDLLDFLEKVKKLGFLTKLDTNGTNPKMLQDALAQKLVDYVAMDIKAPLKKYSQITNSKIDQKLVSISIDTIMNSGIDYEFRTTVVKSQLTLNDFEVIGKEIKGASKYYLQKFVATKTNSEEFMYEETYSDGEFEKIKKILDENIDFVSVR